MTHTDTARRLIEALDAGNRLATTVLGIEDDALRAMAEAVVAMEAGRDRDDLPEPPERWPGCDLAGCCDNERPHIHRRGRTIPARVIATPKEPTNGE